MSDENKEKPIYAIVDQGMCVACGSCQAWSPDVFAYDRLSIAYNRLDDNTGTVPIPREVVEDVVPTGYMCPTRAIKLANEPFIGFVQTPEFGSESPDNEKISYELKENEVTVNEITEQATPEAYRGTMKSRHEEAKTGFDENLDPEDTP